jgi:adenylylsulfate kinase-like enzyme/ubiquinone/menaquinone biosynthesis C-methylase UbiE
MNFMKKGMLIWITGLSGCGKTTIGVELQKIMLEKNHSVVLIDGDLIREVTSEDLGYAIEDRLTDAYRKAKLCRFLTEQGIDVICATISLHHEIHDYNRKYNENYFEILIEEDMNVLKERRPHLYDGKEKHVWGVDLKPEWPKKPNLIVDNSKIFKEKINLIIKLIMGDDHMNKESVNKPEWDYTKMAKFYSARPNYAEKAIQKICEYVKAVKEGEYLVADIGAGTGNLTIMLADKIATIIAIEPNKAMREIGLERTKEMTNVSWIIGTGEETTLEDNSVNMVTFGSSFNTTNREESLKESHRILKENGFFVSMWNNRDLDVPSQKKVETIIRKWVPDYSHGTRRESQANVIMDRNYSITFFI